MIPRHGMPRLNAIAFWPLVILRTLSEFEW